MDNNAEEVSRTGAAGLDLEAIEARYKASTSGGWRRELFPDGQHAEPDIYSGEQEIAWTFYYKDGEFIAHSHQDIPALLAEVRRLRAVLAAAKAVVDTCVVSEGEDEYPDGMRYAFTDYDFDEELLNKLRAAIEVAQSGLEGE